MTDIYRVEGMGTDPELTEGLAAAVADPLWLLARQWQVGEFKGEDAASPVIVEAVVDSYPVAEIVADAKGSRARAFDPATAPLEPMVEAETAVETLTPRERLQAALRLLRALTAAKVDTEDFGAALRKLHGFRAAELAAPGDPVGEMRLRLMARTGFDPLRLMAAFAEAGEVFAKLEAAAALPPGQLADAQAAFDRWRTAETGLAVTRDPKTPSRWLDKRQEYRFALATEALDGDGGRIVLAAPDHAGGRLDWHRFDLVAEPKELPEMNRQTVTALASPLRFAGQPAQRFWEIEEGQVYFGDLAGGATDLSRSVLGAYAAVAGDDWFVLPVRVPPGHVARVAGLRVRDNFSDGWHHIASTAENDARADTSRVWRFFEHRDLTGRKEVRRPLLFVPPAIGSASRSAPVEEVHFRRDEMANLAWAIERRHPGAYGRGIEPVRPVRPQLPEPEDPDDWVFQLGQLLPDHWFPLVPVRIGRSAEVALRRGRLLQSAGVVPPVPRGRLLLPGRAFVIEEAEVPNGGTEVRRAWRMARGPDGSRHLWMGRRKVPSSGPMRSSPLIYDTLSGWRPAAE